MNQINDEVKGLDVISPTISAELQSFTVLVGYPDLAEDLQVKLNDQIQVKYYNQKAPISELDTTGFHKDVLICLQGLQMGHKTIFLTHSLANKEFSVSTTKFNVLKLMDSEICADPTQALFEAKAGAEVVLAPVKKAKPQQAKDEEGNPWGGDILDNLNDPPPKYFIRDVLPQSAVGILFGITGCYKTFIANSLCFAVVHNTDWGNHKNDYGKKGRVLYICCEGQGGFVTRFRGAAIRDGLPEKGTFQWINKKIPSLLTPENALSIIKHFGHDTDPFELIVIDTISRVVAGGNTNDEQTMAVALNNAELFKTPTTTVLLVGHPSRGNEYMVRGSGAQEGNVDFLLHCEKRDVDGKKLGSGKKKGKGKSDEYSDDDDENIQGKDTRVGLITCQKQKEGKADTQIRFTVEEQVVELADSPDKQDLTTFVVAFDIDGQKPLNKKATILRQIEIRQPVSIATLVTDLQELSGCQKQNLAAMLNKDAADNTPSKNYGAASLKKYVTKIETPEGDRYKLNKEGVKFVLAAQGIPLGTKTHTFVKPDQAEKSYVEPCSSTSL